ncbi:MAG: cytochrome c biogenesis CcdA family protein [Patescibacteria group bacterium]
MTLLVAFAAGIVTVASPCTLPLLPIVFSIAANGTHKYRPYALVGGFISVKVVSILAIATLGSFLGISTGAWRLIAAVFFGFFGILSLLPTLGAMVFGKLKLVFAKASPHELIGQADLGSAFLAGGALALVWAPCAGPALGSIAILIASSANIVRGGFLLTIFALGVGVPMLLIAQSGTRASAKLERLTKTIPWLQRLFGLLLIGIAIALYTHADLRFQSWFLNLAPAWYASGNWRI